MNKDEKALTIALKSVVRATARTIVMPELTYKIRASNVGYVDCIEIWMGAVRYGAIIPMRNYSGNTFPDYQIHTYRNGMMDITGGGSVLQNAIQIVEDEYRTLQNAIEQEVK